MNYNSFCFWGNIYEAHTGCIKGGGELQISLLADGLAKKGHTVYVVDFQIEEDITTSGIRFLSLRKRQKSNLFNFFSFYVILKKVNADYYYARIRTGLHLIGFLAAKRNRSKFIIGIAHDLDTLGFSARRKYFYSQMKESKSLTRRWLSDIVYDFTIKRADKILSQHNNQKENLKNRIGKSSVVYPNIFSNRNNFISNCSGQKDSNFYTFIGSLDKRKGVDDLYTIVEALPEVNFIIIGRCRDPHAKKIMEVVNNLENCDWLGYIDNRKIYAYLEKSKAYISTSKLEGFPNTFIEAWSMGTPVLSLNVDPGDVITDHNLGVYYNGDLNKIIEDIRNNNIDVNSNELIQYVNKYHAQNKINEFLELIR